MVAGALDTILIPSLRLEEILSDGSTLTNPAVDSRRLFLGEDGLLHLRDSAGNITTPGGGLADQGTATYLDFTTAAAPASPAAGKIRVYSVTGDHLAQKTSGGTQTLLDQAGGGSFAGRPLLVAPEGIGGITGSFGWAANEAHIWPIVIPGEMLVQSAIFDMGLAATGTYEWGLFSFASSLTTMSKEAGGSGALNGTGWVAIDATGAPDTVPAGAYLFIAKAPAANMGEIRYLTQNTIPGAIKNQASYTWDDTPDATTGWTSINGVYRFMLKGRLDATTQY